MKKLLRIAVLLVFSPLLLLAQSVEEIQSSKEYIWGTGNAPTLSKADNEALAALISQISTNVSSHFNQLTEGGTDGDKATVDETFKSVINTYSRATLNNTRRIVIENEPKAAVMRYIKVSEIQRIFEGRKTKLLDFTQEAIKAEKKAQVADALRYYYWALILLQSYPDGNFLKMKDEAGVDQLLCSWIPKQINDIFAHLEITMDNVHIDNDLKTIDLKVLYKGQPARNYDYTYFDGRDWSNIFSVKDGLGVIEMPAVASAKGMQIKTEYMFEGESNIDNELAEVMQSVNPIPMRNCYLKLSGEEPKPKEKANEGTTQMAGTDSSKQTESGMRYLGESETSVYQSTMQAIETAIHQKNYANIQSICTSEGFNMFNQLIKYGNAKIVKTPEYKYLECNGEISCRSIPMSFTFSGNRRTFVEDLVFTLTKEGKIDAITFGLNKPAVDDILGQTSWNDNVRKVLINFLENYKTAYALKRYDYINSIFSEDALIITGSVLKRKVGVETPTLKNGTTFIRQSKAEFMKRLKHIFAGNEYINLRFADNQIRKSGVGGEIYGIQIKQDYFSSSYGDTGYLFLMVDLNNPKEPIIHVRTWQPEKDPNFGVIDLSHF